MVSGLCHVSGQAATDLGFIEAAPAFEICGFPIRGMEFFNFKVQNVSAEPLLAIFGECEDTLMFGCQLENGKVIAAPLSSSQSWATYPGSVETIDLRLYAQVWSCDKTLFTPRVYFDESEIFTPIDGFESADIIATQADKEKIIRQASGKSIVFQKNDKTELARLTDTGRLGIGTNAPSQLLHVEGTNFIVTRFARTGSTATVSQQFQNDAGTITFAFGPTGSEEGLLRVNGDNTVDLGSASFRWRTVYAGTGTINTSDEREKTFLTIEDAEKSAALEIKSNLRKFKFNDAVEVKGSDARIHFGASAQQVGEIMQSHGLEPTMYGFYCYDEWDEVQEEIDDGNVVQQYRPAGNRYGIRYEELLCFIMAAI
jgi:hypothetical protein